MQALEVMKSEEDKNFSKAKKEKVQYFQVNALVSQHITVGKNAANWKDG